MYTNLFADGLIIYYSRSIHFSGEAAALVFLGGSKPLQHNSAISIYMLPIPFCLYVKKIYFCL